MLSSLVFPEKWFRRVSVIINSPNALETKPTHEILFISITTTNFVAIVITKLLMNNLFKRYCDGVNKGFFLQLFMLNVKIINRLNIIRKFKMCHL